MTTLDDKELERIAKDIILGINYGEKHFHEPWEYIAKALKQIRDARLKGPSKSDFERFIFLNFGQMDKERSGHHMKNGAKKTFDWLRSQLCLEPAETKLRIPTEEESMAAYREMFPLPSEGLPYHAWASCYRWLHEHLRLEPAETKARVSDEEILKLTENYKLPCASCFDDGFRAAEKHHGIKGDE